MKKQILFLSLTLITSSFYAAANIQKKLLLIDEKNRIKKRVEEIDKAIAIAAAKPDMAELMRQAALLKQATDQLSEINTLFEELEKNS